jgi:hypothetical protein
MNNKSLLSLSANKYQLKDYILIKVHNFYGLMSYHGCIEARRLKKITSATINNFKNGSTKIMERRNKLKRAMRENMLEKLYQEVVAHVS